MSQTPFLIRMLALELSLLAVLLCGCVATRSENRDRIGDFVLNMASSGSGSTAAVTRAEDLRHESRRKQSTA